MSSIRSRHRPVLTASSGIPSRCPSKKKDGQKMKLNLMEKIALNATLGLAALLLVCAVAAAQNTQGVIASRSGASMKLQTPDSETVTVILTPSTQVEESEGVFKARQKQFGLTVLTPGLR